MLTDKSKASGPLTPFATATRPQVNMCSFPKVNRAEFLCRPIASGEGSNVKPF
jgi:hypothetical protein